LRTKARARLSSWDTPSATGWPACWQPTVLIWCARSHSCPPRVRQAIRNSADSSLSEAERVEALQFAFFAPGNDPRGWLEGWHPEVLQAQRIAGDRTSREEDFAAGRAPILYLQPDHDPLAHVADATAYKEQFAERVTIVVIEQSSHAVIAEQPDAVSAALICYACQLWRAGSGE
jgi:pimeloyl-ACP methyl ester carboxylesterase